MTAVKSFAVTALFLFTGFGSGDISVKSDIGEDYLVKKTSVVTHIFPVEASIENIENAIAFFQEGWDGQVSDCVREGKGSKDECYELLSDVWQTPITKFKEQLKILKTVPVTRFVRFRTVRTDLNGFKTASGYWNVVCVPDGIQEQRKKWGEVVVDALEKGFPNTVWSAHLSEDGSVAGKISSAVCKRYGK